MTELQSPVPFTIPEGEPEGLLLPYQQRWVADKAKVKVAEKSRRIGLTWGEAADDVLTAATRRGEGGMDVFYTGYNKDMALEYIRTCAGWARALQYAVSDISEAEEMFEDSEKGIQSFNIWFNSGFRICALSSRPSNLRGRQGVVVIDEAAFHCDLEELLKAAIALLMWGGSVRVISTHDGDDNPFAVLVNDIRAGRQAGSLHRITFRDAVSEGLDKRVARQRRETWSPEWSQQFVAEMYAFYRHNAAEELDVIPRPGGGAYLTRAQILAAQDPDVPVLRFSPPKAWEDLPARVRKDEMNDWLVANVTPVLHRLDPRLRTYLGSDFARRRHKSVMWPVQRLPNESIRTAFVVELARVPHDQQLQALTYICDHLPRFSGGAADASGNGSYVAEKARERYGPKFIEVTLSQPWYRENMPRLRASIEDRTFTIPQHADVTEDLRSIVEKNGVAQVAERETLGSDGELRHGDSAVAAVLALFAVENSPSVPIEFQSAGARASLGDGTAGTRITDTGFGSVAGEAGELQGY